MWPLIEVAIELKWAADKARLNNALETLAIEDSSFGFRVDRKTEETIASGISEAQLDAKLDLLRYRHSIDTMLGRKKIAFRETIESRTEIIYTHKRQSATGGQYAEVTIVFEPGEPGSGYSFESRVAFGIVPERFIHTVERCLEAQKEEGVLAGFRTIDLKVTLVDGKYHDTDSSEATFEIAARGAFRQLQEDGRPVIVEPIMHVVVSSPHEYVGRISRDLRDRRGMIEASEVKDGEQTITAFVPLQGMIGYETVLADLIGDAARIAMRYERYQAMPMPEPPDGLFPTAVGMRA